MNARHLELCSSDEWAETVQRYIIPSTLQGIELGDDVLEVGPGPGRTTDVLRGMVGQLTAVEVDADLAEALARRLAGSNVEVVHADATRLPFPAGRFSAAISLTMLHHVPSMELQDKLFGEVARVLRPGGLFVGTDSLDSEGFRELHVDDICVPIAPEGLEQRLLRAGFTGVRVDTNPPYSVRFEAATPASGGRLHPGAKWQHPPVRDKGRITAPRCGIRCRRRRRSKARCFHPGRTSSDASTGGEAPCAARRRSGPGRVPRLCRCSCR
jgi:SAM-dependent methyltransferase